MKKTLLITVFLVLFSCSKKNTETIGESSSSFSSDSTVKDTTVLVDTTSK